MFTHDPEPSPFWILFWKENGIDIPSTNKNQGKIRSEKPK